MPNKALNITAAVLYFVVAIILTACQFEWGTVLEIQCLHTVNFKWRANYFLCLVIGAYCEAIGIVLRIVMRNNLHSSGLYIAQYLFVVLSVGPA